MDAKVITAEMANHMMVWGAIGKPNQREWVAGGRSTYEKNDGLYPSGYSLFTTAPPNQLAEIEQARVNPKPPGAGQADRKRVEQGKRLEFRRVLFRSRTMGSIPAAIRSSPPRPPTNWPKSSRRASIPSRPGPDKQIGREWSRGRDWSSDVCSSDLERWARSQRLFALHHRAPQPTGRNRAGARQSQAARVRTSRSEESGAGEETGVQTCALPI